MYNSNFSCATLDLTKRWSKTINHVQPATKSWKFVWKMPEETQLPRPVCHIEACKDNTEHVHACVSIVGKHVMPDAEMLAPSSCCHEMPGNLFGDAGRDTIARPVCTSSCCHKIPGHDVGNVDGDRMTPTSVPHTSLQIQL